MVCRTILGILTTWSLVILAAGTTFGMAILEAGLHNTNLIGVSIITGIALILCVIVNIAISNEEKTLKVHRS